MTSRGSIWRSTVVALALAAALPSAAADQAAAPAGASGSQPTLRLRSTTNRDRELAAARARQRAGKALSPAHKRLLELNAPAKAKPAAPAAKAGSGSAALGGAPGALLGMVLGQMPAPDLFAFPNFANSPLPRATCLCPPGSLLTCAANLLTPAGGCLKDADCGGYADGATCTGAVVSGGIKKFVDSLAPLCTLGKNTIGQCLPVATPDRATFPGADYYEIGVKDYTAQFHSDLPASTRVRGYYQKNNVAGGLDPLGDAANPHYLGPVIIAQRGRPVRVLMTNEVGTGAAGNLFIPVDPTIVGAGKGPLTAAGLACNPLDPLQVGNCASYPENRATFHLHGGNTPWISDGTQHQWTAAKGELTPFKKGLVTRDVPDMPTGDGQMSFYWTNDQSGRMMFYHDHAYGITRLNVYAGEAAGYVLADPVEENALAAAGVPGTLAGAFDPTKVLDAAHYLPLVIQDKTFVPPADQLAQQDPTWDVTKYGGPGNFWFPHVYTPNQWPTSPNLDGANPFGRWDYGPWFHPAQTVLTAGQLEVPCYTAALPGAPGTPNTLCPGTPNPSIVPESFLDTPMVNGTVYPTVTVEPTAYRFQILNAAQERNWSLSLFVADASGTEVPMVDAVPHSATSAIPKCNAAAPLSAITGLPVGPDIATVCYPTTWPTDGRDGGVPDPAAAGPAIWQIGSEGGLLPSIVRIPPNPVTYEYNRRNIVVLNVLDKGLFMGPAERADVVVDFSAYAGKTLILYNDAPAPVPAFDTRIDYYTGDPDQTSTGGAPTTLPGYGPNTRTIMQIKVAASAAAPSSFVPTAASATLKALFATQQGTPVVPEAAYTGMYPAGTLANTYFSAQGTSATVTPVETQTAANPAGTPQLFTFGQKAIQELFDADYGRMNATLGVEMPLTNFLNQTTVPYANFDPATEFLEDGKPQIWKITHNGVDTHTIHFHLLNLQVVNRVGWDGAIRPPDANELGWKESIRMHPLEDIYVAMKPVKMAPLPWPLPDMWRPLDVTLPLGTTTQFTGVDITNLPITVQNQVQNFGWEYVWHCHLLGHEENDMLRAEIFVTAPEAPATLAAAATGTPASATATLTWKDASASAMTFNVQRSTDGFATIQKSTTLNAPLPNGGTVTLTDTIAPFNPAAAYQYRVQAAKAISSLAIPATIQGSTTLPYTASSAWVATALATAPGISVAPASLAFGSVAVNATKVMTTTVTNSGLAPLTVTGVTVGGANAALFTQANTCGAAVAPGATCVVTVTFAPTAAIAAATATLAIASNVAATPTVNVPLTGAGTVGPPATPTNLAARVTMNPPTVTLTWTNNAPAATGYTVQRATNAAFTANLQTFNVVGAANTTYVDTAVTRGTTYYYRVRAVAGAQNSAYTAPGLQVIVSIRFVRVAAATPQAPTASVTATFTGAQAAGNLNVVAIGWWTPAVTITSVTDTAGNVYSPIVQTTGTGVTQALYYAPNVKAAAANAVTVTFSGNASFPDLRILEYFGVSALDQSRGASGAVALSSSGAVTTTAANELIFGANVVANTTTGPGAGFTSRIITNPNSDIAEDRIVTAIGNYTATAPTTAAFGWVMQVATFK